MMKRKQSVPDGCHKAPCRAKRRGLRHRLIIMIMIAAALIRFMALPTSAASGTGNPGRMQILSQVVLPYSVKEASNTNAKLACEYLDGTAVAAGETFSYNAVIGKRTQERGFVEADIINAGSVAQSFGGGICKISTMLYQNCLLSGMPVNEHHHHTLQVEYAQDGFDAAVSWGTLDFCFTNNTRQPVLISAVYDDRKRIFTVTFLGVAREGEDKTKRILVSHQVGEYTFRPFRITYVNGRRVETKMLGQVYYYGRDF